jgi:opacity protein-like surface antigen
MLCLLWLGAALDRALAAGQYSSGAQPGATPQSATTAKAQRIPLEITAGVDLGYDDNVIGTNSVNSNGGGSFFTRESLVLSYDRPMEQTDIRAIGVAHFSQFLDVGTDDKAGNLTLAMTHNFSQRLTVSDDLFASYQTEPDFAADVGPENVRSPHYFITNVAAITYHWLPRLAFVTSYNFQRVKYVENSAQTDFQNRFDNLLSEEAVFNLTRRTILLGEYRFEDTEYDTAPLNSTTHYAIAGVDHHLTEHFDARLLGGATFRVFENGGERTDPYAEADFLYQGGNHTLGWRTSYRVEQPSVQPAVARQTIRTGLTLTYNLTSRLSSTSAFFFHHDENEGASQNTTTSTQDSLELVLGFRYTINKHFAARLNYEYSTVTSAGDQTGYSRNRVFGGVTYTY